MIPALTKTRPEQLADALFQVARVNHYMVGIIDPITPAELDQAEQILIDGQNACPKTNGARFRQYDLALDLVEHYRRQWRDPKNAERARAIIDPFTPEPDPRD